VPDRQENASVRRCYCFAVGLSMPTTVTTYGSLEGRHSAVEVVFRTTGQAESFRSKLVAVVTDRDRTFCHGRSQNPG
jgi:hypothetical protein